jgi:beta-galactosidase
VRAQNVQVAGGTITFDPVQTTRLRLDMTSPAPMTGTGFLGISELRVG